MEGLVSTKLREFGCELPGKVVYVSAFVAAFCIKNEKGEYVPAEEGFRIYWITTGIVYGPERLLKPER